MHIRQITCDQFILKSHIKVYFATFIKPLGSIKIMLLWLPFEISLIIMITMKKSSKIVYLVATGLLTALMMMSAGMYIFNHEMVSETFTRLGYPTYIIYPLAMAKIFGLIAIWTGKSKTLKEWAYAGFFFDFILAVSAHISLNDGEFGPALVAIVLLFASYIYGKKIAGEARND